MCRILFLTLLAAAAIQAAVWRPLDQEHLSLAGPAVEKDADAEILIWDVRVEDKPASVILIHYLRLRVFTDKGSKDLSSINIPLFGKRRVADLAARTIAPDGTITEMQQDAVFQKDLFRLGRRIRVRATSFAVPNVGPGSIIEYQYKEIRDGEWSDYIQLPFSREYPIHSVTYHIKPQSMSMRGYPHLLPERPLEKERGGFSALTMTNVPAFREEPDMPPESAVRPWLLVYYSDQDPIPEQFWKIQGLEQHRQFREVAKVSSEVRRIAAELVTGLSSDDEKLAKLANWCHTTVKNINSEGSGLSPAQRDAFKPNRAPADTIKQRIGTGEDINMLFAALAMSHGYDVRSVRIADRSQTLFDANFPSLHFLNSHSLAIRAGDSWKFYDPATSYLPPGMLRWQEEASVALLSDANGGRLITTPLSGAGISMCRRRAELVLAEDGTVEGTLTLSYTGHASVDQKNAYDQDSPDKRADRIRDLYKAYFPAAEITAVQIDDNIADNTKPFSYSLRIKVPGYAQRTGKRLLFQPAFFQAGRPPRFPLTTRRHDIYFDYPWSEEDQVQIAIPNGFHLDNAMAPPSTSFGKTGEYEASLHVTKAEVDRKLLFKRRFVFGGDGSIIFSRATYPAVKKAFDFVHEQDNHMLSLKMAAQ